MLKFGFVGVGQVGGLFVDEAKKYNHETLAFNTANIDLNVLTHLEKQEKVHLIGYNGAGKDRSIGEEAFLSHKEMISERIFEKMKECHVIFPVFAIGGGTGSGMSALLTKTLTEIFTDKVISPILFLPDRNESLRAKMNALEAFSEISAIEDIGAMFTIDNQKVMELNHSFTLKEKYEMTRKELIEMLNHFNKSTVKESDISNLDKMDFLTALSERGCAMITELSIDTEDVKKPTQLGTRFEKSLEFSIFSKSNLAHLSKVALLAEVESELTKSLKLESIFNEIGTPLEVFTGIYETEKESTLHVLLTGLPFPTELLKEMEEDVRIKEDQIVKTLDSARNQSFSVKSSWTNSLKRNRRIKV